MTLEALPPPGERVLDVGCGTGLFLAELRRAAASGGFHGVDLSLAMLAAARERLGEGARLVRGGAEALPYRDGSFDMVTSLSVLHYVPRPHEALREARRVLRPAGVVVLTDWCADFLPMRLLGAWLRLRDEAYVRTYTVDEVEGMLREAGLRPSAVRRRRVAGLWGIMTITARR